MTEQQSWEPPVYDQADRMRKSLRESGVGIGEMADYLEVSRETVGRWINGHNRPRPRDMRRWALRTGFPMVWLETGKAPTDGPGPSVARSEGFEPPTF